MSLKGFERVLHGTGHPYIASTDAMSSKLSGHLIMISCLLSEVTENLILDIDISFWLKL